jgi:hypothetical protein
VAELYPKAKQGAPNEEQPLLINGRRERPSRQLCRLRLRLGDCV